MSPIIILDLVLLGTLFCVSIGFVWFQISKNTWLEDTMERMSVRSSHT